MAGGFTFQPLLILQPMAHTDAVQFTLTSSAVPSLHNREIHMRGSSD